MATEKQKGEGPKICPKHHVEMELHQEIIQVPETDENGNDVMSEKVVQFYVCLQCEYDEPDPLDYIEEGPQVEQALTEKITKYKEINPAFTPHNVHGNLMGELMEYHKNTDADELPRKAMAQYQIATALMNAVSANAKGKILPNLGFFWAEPSGTNKTPLLISGVDDFMLDVYSGHTRYETGTAKGMMRSLSKKHRDDPKKKIDLMITWDEAQDILSLLLQSSTADILSFFCQALDNRIQAYTTIARGEEKPPPLTANIWISGVPEMVEKTLKSFWFQGAGNRFLFVKSKNIMIKDIHRATNDNRNKEYLIEELKRLNNIRMVEYSDDFLVAYNEYRRKILEAIANIQTDMSASQDIDNYDVLSRIKYPVLVWKLAIIYAASRGNFDGELLKMGVEDLENAKADLEIYHDNAMAMFSYWLEKFTKDAEIRNSQRVKKKFEKHIQSILKHEDKRWVVQLIVRETGNKTGRPGESKTEKVMEAIRSPDGTWVKESDLQSYANMMARDFSDAVETLKAQEYLVSREAAYNKDGTSGGLLGAVFYGWKGSKTSPSSSSENKNT